MKLFSGFLVLQRRPASAPPREEVALNAAGWDHCPVSTSSYLYEVALTCSSYYAHQASLLLASKRDKVAERATAAYAARERKGPGRARGVVGVIINRSRPGRTRTPRPLLPACRCDGGARGSAASRWRSICVSRFEHDCYRWHGATRLLVDPNAA